MELDRRVLRKRGVLVAGGENPGGAELQADAATKRRLTRLNAVAATAFVVGGSLFCVGALLAQAHVGGPRLAAALFMVAAIAAYVRPETGDELAVGVANWATFAGAACFAIAGVMQEFERP